MKVSKWSLWLVGTTLLLTQQVHAFGGLWSAQNAVKQASEKILFVDNPDSTITAIVQIDYAGPAEKFAWLVPVPGEVKLAVSSATVFQRLDAATAPEYWLEVSLDQTCDADAAYPSSDVGSETGGATSEPDSTAATVEVIAEGVVGPYDYVNLAVDAAAEEPAKVATDWLRANGFDVTGMEAKLGPYLEEGLHVLAFKLSQGSDVGAIRPVMLTYERELPMIPLRPAAVAAQAELGIQVWIVGPSQAVPANYKSLVINDARIDWLSARKFRHGTLPAGGVGPFGPIVSKPSNYQALVSAAANEAGGQGFVTELGGPARQYRDMLWSGVDGDAYTSISTQSYEDGIDAIVAALAAYAGWDGLKDAIAGGAVLPEGVTIEEFARAPEEYRDQARVNTAKFLQLLDERVVRPVIDAGALLHNAPYLTRLFTAISADEMTLDPVFAYNGDLAQVGNVHIARQATGCSADAAWRIELPQGGVVKGAGTTWPAPLGSLPASLKVVALSTSGSGEVVRDNTQQISESLFAAAGESGSTTLQPPQNGLLIGGTHDVTRREPIRVASEPEAAGGGCNAARTGRTRGAAWLLLAVLLVALRRRSSRRMAAVACLLLSACSSDAEVPMPGDTEAPLTPGALSREQLRDPESCKGCHPIHYREWSASMHAYAAKDPVFIAMNARGQRETNGELGDFCIQCHAPMAVADKLSKDGLNLDELPDRNRGVSCYFCHNVASIEGDHNGKLALAHDNTMRGPIRDPLQPPAHRAEYSEIFEEENPKSSAMCGGCHDIVTPTGVHLERTFQEYRAGIFSKSSTGKPPAFASCVGCHMPGQNALAAVAPAGTTERTVHEHLWPGIDVALIDHPHREAMRSAVEDCQLAAASFSFFKLEVTPPDLFTFEFETNAGHNQPSGAAQDRRMWLEFMAYDASGALIESVSSGNIADGELEEKPKKDPKHDPSLLMFRDRIFDAQGKPVHMFWEAEKSPAYPEGYTSSALPVASTTYIEGKHTVVKQYRALGPDGQLPARVTARLRIRPIGVDVLRDLVESGDLDPAIAAQMPTLNFAAQIEWTPESGLMKPISAALETNCTSYRCMLDPSSNDCKGK
ncbi:MAG TPA: DUF2330 domain-containing protein [Polyangiales bacterium]|nr:DUF2330 domain-containing protein [Polyangiales bacterium]